MPSFPESLITWKSYLGLTITNLGKGAVLTARAAAFRDVPDGAVYGGVPARPHRQWLQEQAQLSRLRDLRNRRDPCASLPSRQVDEELDDC